MLTIADIVEGTGGELVPGAGEPPDGSAGFSSVSIDSRACRPGGLFVALAGEQHDGHDFVDEAVRCGAIGVIAKAARAAEIARKGAPLVVAVPNTLVALQNLARFWRRRYSVKVVGITGSLGKTTTKELTAGVLGRRYRVLKNEGNLNSEFGLPLTLLQLNRSHQVAVLEMGAYYGGEIAELAAIAEPEVGVVTTVAPVHLERMGTLEAVVATKSELVAALPESGTAVLNGDNDLVREMRSKAKGRVLLYGTAPDCDLRASDLQSFGLEGIEFRMHWEGCQRQYRVPLLGKHSVYAALAASAVGLLEGMTMEELAGGLASPSAKGRLNIGRGRLGTTIIDDTYNANPDSVVAALDLLREVEGRHIAVLADMLELGSYEEEAHRRVGSHAARSVDHLILYGPLAGMIGEAAVAAGMPAGHVMHSEDKGQVIDHLISTMRSGDVILVKGSRGMAMEEVVQEVLEVN